MTLGNKETATPEQLEKIKEFEIRHSQALLQWTKQYPQRPPPVVWDEIKKDFFWMNRKSRRQRK